MSHLEHIGIALYGEDAVATFERLLEAVTYKTEEVHSESVQTHFIDVGGPRIELLTTDQPDSAIGRFLTKRGEGIHHLAFEVADINATFERVQQAGFPLASGSVSDGADGKRVFFLHPKGTHGVLVEFCQSARSVLSESVVNADDDHFSLHRGGLASGSSVLILADSIDKSATALLVRALEPAHSIWGLERANDTPWPSTAKLSEALNWRSGLPDAIVLRADRSMPFIEELVREEYEGGLIVFVDRQNVDRLLGEVGHRDQTLFVTSGLSTIPPLVAPGRTRPEGTDINLITVPSRHGAYTSEALPLLLPTIRWFLNLRTNH